ncbi:MAG: TetR/AcrR family transcriptional regulator [Rhodospirillaceae bacterium]|nr:TetR/AcrR family transcriptional regulator [Rhodospirillaceae bacterium]
MASKDDTLKVKRRRQIIDATIEAIYRRGIGDTRLADVARAAGVSYGVVSFYFKSKDALLMATMNHVAHEYATALRAAAEIPGQSPMERLLAVASVNFDARVAEPQKTAVWVAIWAQCQVAPAFRKRCCELQDDYVRVTEPLCREIIAAGGYKTMDASEIAKTLCVLMSGLDVEMHLRGRRYSVEDARRTVHALLSGIFPKEFAAAVDTAQPPRRKATAARQGNAVRRRAALAGKPPLRSVAKRQAG